MSKKETLDSIRESEWLAVIDRYKIRVMRLRKALKAMTDPPSLTAVRQEAQRALDEDLKD